jgi:hypothetical protein
MKDLERFLMDECGYVKLRHINGKLCGVTPFIFTWGFAVGLDGTGYEYRYCFEWLNDALSALDKFDGTKDPEDFIVRKGPESEADYKPADRFNEGRPLTEVLKDV